MISQHSQPRLFGLTNSNRDFSQRDSWGKNQFNNSFPASLACYMDFKGLEPVYLTIDKALKIKHSKISVTDIFGINPSSPNLFFAFESDYVPYRKTVIGRLPRVDLVTQEKSSCLRSIEIKLTALPDNSTYRLSEEKYGCEIVTRPDTIVYLALSIANNFQESRQKLFTYLDPVCGDIDDWTSISSVLPMISLLAESVDSLLAESIELQQPLVMQPIWKTIGKTSKLYENCLDIFVWSNFAFTRLFFDITKSFTRLGSETI